MKTGLVVTCVFVALGGAATFAGAQISAKPATAKVAAPKPTAVVLKDAAVLAKKTNRLVLVDFTASWCGWCKLLDKTMSAPDIRPIVEKAFVVVHLDVLENGSQKALENPGGNEFLEKMGGAKSGIPYLVVLDGAGKKLADSKIMPGEQNVGCPASPDEIKAFGEFLKTHAPKLTESERDAILKRLAQNAPKGN